MKLPLTSVGTLSIVAIPIGNPLDITLRAIEILKSSGAVICESQREGSKLAKSLGIEIKEFIEVNEHNESRSGDLIQERLLAGTNIALISDCGTPVFSDPGAKIIARALGIGAKVIPIPGPSSIMAALSIIAHPLPNFYFAGFLPRQTGERNKMMEYLRKMNIPIILMDTPYRMDSILKDSIKAFGPGKKAVLACNLTLPNEAIYRGSLGEINRQAGGKKAEFILIIY